MDAVLGFAAETSSAVEVSIGAEAYRHRVRPVLVLVKIVEPDVSPLSPGRSGRRQFIDGLVAADVWPEADGRTVEFAVRPEDGR